VAERIRPITPHLVTVKSKKNTPIQGGPKKRTPIYCFSAVRFVGPPCI